MKLIAFHLKPGMPLFVASRAVTQRPRWRLRAAQIADINYDIKYFQRLKNRALAIIAGNMSFCHRAREVALHL